MQVNLTSTSLDNTAVKDKVSVAVEPQKNISGSEKPASSYADKVTISAEARAMLETHKVTNTLGQGWGNEPPLTRITGQGWGNEPPLASIAGQGWGNEPPSSKTISQAQGNEST